MTMFVNNLYTWVFQTVVAVLAGFGVNTLHQKCFVNPRPIALLAAT
jgi:hypothetical protein